MKPLSKNIIVFLLSLLVLGVIFSSLNVNTPEVQSIDAATLVQKIEAHEIKQIDVIENDVTAFGLDGTEFSLQKEAGQPFNELLATYGIDAEELKSVPITVKDPGVARGRHHGYRQSQRHRPDRGQGA